MGTAQESYAARTWEGDLVLVNVLREAGGSLCSEESLADRGKGEVPRLSGEGTVACSSLSPASQGHAGEPGSSTAECTDVLVNQLDVVWSRQQSLSARCTEHFRA